MRRPAFVVTAVALLGGTGCASRGGAAAANADRSAADEALRCARSSMQASGFRVRLRDPRDPWTLIADGDQRAGVAERIVVKVLPAADPQDRPTLVAEAQTTRPGVMASSEAREAARRVEANCGGNPFAPSGDSGTAERQGRHD